MKRWPVKPRQVKLWPVKRCSTALAPPAPSRAVLGGFTLIEVLVALTIVATTLMAGLRASATMTRSAERQSSRVLAQLCAENVLVQIRLSQQLPDVGDTQQNCTQGGQSLQLRLLVQPTPNPNFRRIQARVAQNDAPLLQVSTVVGRY